MEAAAKGRADFKINRSTVIKQILGDSQYICGPDYDEFTMAYVSLGWLLICDKSDMLDDEPELKAYLERCLERPAWKKVQVQNLIVAGGAIEVRTNTKWDMSCEVQGPPVKS